MPHRAARRGIEDAAEAEVRGSQYRPASKLDSKVALVTGGDSGIGRAVAVMCAREGADLALIYLREEERDARETEQAIREAGGEALLLPGDVRDEDFCADAVAAVTDRLLRNEGSCPRIHEIAGSESGRQGNSR